MVFAKWLYTDDWRGRADKGAAIPDPSAADLHAAILALDGLRHTMATLSRSQGAEHYLIVAGQWDGRCLVNFTSDNSDFFSLVDPARGEGSRRLFVGGQDGDYKERNLAPLADALRAAEHFRLTGDMALGLAWESDY